MGLTKTRKIGKLINANRKFQAFDSDSINDSYSKGKLTTPGSVLVVSTAEDLPVSSTSGNKALVTSTNTLYLFSNGWYKIAIINNFNPQWITEPNSTYDLAINGTATTITVVASDSDDVPITYTATTDSDFNLIATVTHDSDKHNTWTVVPLDSENGTATGGTGTITFKASDGVNLVSAVSTFTLSFGATYTNTLSSTDYALGTSGATFESSVKKQGTHSLYAVGNGVTSRNPGANSASAVTYNDWTISFWFYINAWRSYNSLLWVHLFCTNDKLGGGYSFGTKGNSLQAHGDYWFATDNYNGSSYGGNHGNVGGSVFSTGVWYHLVFSGSTTGPTIGTWITREGQSFGNVLNRETFGGHSAAASRVSALKIGGTDGLYLHGSNGNAADGGNVYYDDFRVYNAKATAANAQAIFNSAGDVTLNTNPMQSNLKLAYTFDNTANSI